MRVADLGCGVGMATALLAYLVGPTGHVVGLDAPLPGK
jgi:ubiquinone/menaquinone biosynthesis C-methylase UbiE